MYYLFPSYYFQYLRFIKKLYCLFKISESYSYPFFLVSRSYIYLVHDMRNRSWTRLSFFQLVTIFFIFIVFPLRQGGYDNVIAFTNKDFSLRRQNYYAKTIFYCLNQFKFCLFCFHSFKQYFE